MKGNFLMIVAVAGAVLSMVVGMVVVPTVAQTQNGQQGPPIPDANRMFTPDSAEIVQAGADRYMIDLAQTPKNIVAGEPATFVLNLFSDNGTWLWHSDFKITVTKTNGEEVLDMPNIHGHGSMAQFTYTFPSAGQYNINVITGQQVDSPNYIPPKVVREEQFVVDVLESTQTTSSLDNNNTTETTQAAEVKEIPLQAASWSFSPTEIRVNQGDVVRLLITTAQDEVALYNGHGFGIEGYNVNAFLVKGTTQEVEFKADKAGEFVFRCTSFCVHGEGVDPNNHFNMVGRLIVEDTGAETTTPATTTGGETTTAAQSIDTLGQ
jgi:heme/copper-type cytochrome/quinol oxidase subunit 2